MIGAVTVSRFEIPVGKDREYEEMLRSFGDEVADDKGFVATSVWQDIDSPHKFMRVTAFRDFDSLFSSYDEMVASGFLEAAVEKWGIAPDVMRVEPVARHGVGVEQFRTHDVMSLSIRAMEPGYGDEWIEKMKYNFEEVSVLPGMEGWFIGRSDEVEDEIVGMVSWDTEEACRRTIPDSVHYDIRVFRRYR
ncbi:hypothetical protein CCB80_07940 [Armatimonadetes bacterium Uphvl-Ar1]|nr:hypothetical protein CCB80_07940 [Armatimonadetes bacterium Uphvl-Ar1]